MRVLSFFAEEEPFWPLDGARNGRCGGLIEREGKPYGFPSHILSLSRARKVGKSALRCPLRRALAPRRGAQPLFAPP